MAKDWRSGKPVRVVRNMKGGKHSKYAPAEGNRYDGIYKVSCPCCPQPCSPWPRPPWPRPCWPRPRSQPSPAPAGAPEPHGLLQVVKYWPEKGKSGFLVWRYLLRRDDDEPGPWTKEGKDRIKKLGLTMQVLSFFFFFCRLSGCPRWGAGATLGSASEQPPGRAPWLRAASELLWRGGGFGG